jgi:hypothetical protein
MAKGLNLNLELLAGKKCMGTSVMGLRRDKKSCVRPTQHIWHLSKPSIPSFHELCTKTEEIFSKSHFLFTLINTADKSWNG